MSPRAAIGLLLVVGSRAASAQSGVIVDPENVPAATTSGTIVDPENVPATTAGAIVDPDNVPATTTGAIVDPDNVPATTTGAIVDPDNVSPAPAPAQPSFAARTTFRGEAETAVFVDTAHQDGSEDLIEALGRLELRVRHVFSPVWSATLEGSLEYRVTAASDDPEDPVLAVDGDRWQGRVEPVLGEMFVGARVGNWLLRMGNLVVTWGVSDFTSPADVVNPRDMGRMITSSGGDGAIAIPAVDAVWVRGPVAWQFVLAPFYVANQVDTFGTDQALFRAASPLAELAPVSAAAALLDPSLEEFAQPLLTSTRRPDEVPQNASAGTRATVTAAGADLSVGYWFGWDRAPSLTLSDSFREFIAAADPADPFAVSGELLSVVADVQAGRTVFAAVPERLHVVELDAVRYFGPIGVRLEATFSPERTWIVLPIASVRRPTVAGSLGVGWESSTGELVVGVEGFGTYVARRSSDSDYLLGSDRLAGVVGGVEWDVGSVVVDGAVAERLRLRLGGVWLATQRDALVAAEVGWELGENGLIAVEGTAVVDGDGPTIGVGDSYRGNDQIGLRYRSAF